MLPVYIIEELEKIGNEEPGEQIYIERPDSDDPMYRQPNPDSGKPDEQRRGVVIIDYTI